VRVIPYDGERYFPDNLPEKKEVPAIGGRPTEVSPADAARIGWYNLKEDQFVVTKATAFPYGFDKCATTPNKCTPKEGENPPTWADEKMNEFVVDAVIADENGKRYVNVLELAAVRTDGCVYVIRGRIEKSSWRDKDDSWVNILMVMQEGARNSLSWAKTHPDHWCADPVEAEVAQGSAGYQSRVAPQETRPAQSFEEYKDAFMVKFQEAIVKAGEQRKEKEAAMAERDAAKKMTGTFKISHDGKVVMEIDKGKFNQKWSKDGDKLKGPGGIMDFWEIDLLKVIKKNGKTPKGTNRTHGWMIEKDKIGRQIGQGAHVSAMTEDQYHLKDNKVTHKPSGKVWTIEGDSMDTKTLAFALVAMGVLDPNDAGTDR